MSDLAIPVINVVR